MDKQSTKLLQIESKILADDYPQKTSRAQILDWSNPHTMHV